jgi:hypothetical protein
VYRSLSVNPSEEALRRLLTTYPLVVRREQPPPAVVPISALSVEELRRIYKDLSVKLMLEEVRAAARREAERALRRGAIILPAPTGEECLAVLDEMHCFMESSACRDNCAVLLLAKLYRSGRITEAEYEEGKRNLRLACEIIKRNMDFFRLALGVTAPPPGVKKGIGPC